MFLVVLFTFLLISGIGVAQALDISLWRDYVSTATIICLAYIMIEVGLEFTIDQSKWKSYLRDFSIAMTAAIFPVVLCVIYFITVFHLPLKQSVLVGMSTAPTSAGVLFSMLIAAGLGMTWVFQKARILAIFDDLGTILLMVVIKIWLTGFHVELLWAICILTFLGVLGFRFQNQLKIPTAKGWLLGYAVFLTVLTALIEHTANIHLEILFPAFILGSILHNPLHHPENQKAKGGQGDKKITETRKSIIFDQTVKGFFMFLVGCSLPKIEIEGLSWAVVAGHVLVLMVFSNIGKCFPIFAYRKDVPFRERLALSVAMFPRGEVGAGVLLIALGYGIGGLAVGVAVLTMALNLLCTGFFILIIMKLVGEKKRLPERHAE